MLDILNHSYNHIKKKKYINFSKHSDSVLISILKEMSLKGWNQLNSLELDKEVGCNKLCASIALINFDLIKKKIFNDLNILEKLYLAFFYMFTNTGCTADECKDFFKKSISWHQNKGIQDYFKKEIKKEINYIDTLEKKRGIEKHKTHLKKKNIHFSGNKNPAGIPLGNR